MDMFAGDRETALRSVAGTSTAAAHCKTGQQRPHCGMLAPGDAGHVDLRTWRPAPKKRSRPHLASRTTTMGWFWSTAAAAAVGWMGT